MFNDAKRELLGPHDIDMENTNNDMSGFGNDNCCADSIGSFNIDGISSSNDFTGNADGGFGDSCDNSSDAGDGMSM